MDISTAQRSAAFPSTLSNLHLHGQGDTANGIKAYE